MLPKAGDEVHQNPEETTTTLGDGALFVVKGTQEEGPATKTLVTMTPTTQGTTKSIALPVETSTKCPTDRAMSVMEAGAMETGAEEAIDLRLLKEEVESQKLSSWREAISL